MIIIAFVANFHDYSYIPSGCNLSSIMEPTTKILVNQVSHVVGNISTPLKANKFLMILLWWIGLSCGIKNLWFTKLILRKFMIIFVGVNWEADDFYGFWFVTDQIDCVCLWLDVMFLLMRILLLRSFSYKGTYRVTIYLLSCSPLLRMVYM